MLFVAIFVYEQVINEKEIIKLTGNIQLLKIERDSLKTFERHGISIGDTTLQFTTKLNINGKPYKYLHVKRIKKGKNKFYFVLTEGVGVDLIVNKY